MSDFTAKDVQKLRQSAGVGMMDAKKALQDSGGDIEKAKQPKSRIEQEAADRGDTLAKLSLQYLADVSDRRIEVPEEVTDTT